MTRTATLGMPGGVRVIVPDGLNFLTAYVLYEQQDWFEDELPFLRICLTPGQHAIDIGANYGVYTLSMAQLVGSAGAVWAFEPSSSTAVFLGQSLQANDFRQVMLECSALSSSSGTAYLIVSDNAELNSIVKDETPGSAHEVVTVTTLDNCMERYDWRKIDFVKIDAEGEENNIIKGGENFLQRHSPLILYEVKAGDDLHLELVDSFAERGYESYRLVPGLDVLVPFDGHAYSDAYLLNLFCCKKDRARLLAEQGFLIEKEALSRGVDEFRSIFEARRAKYSPLSNLSATIYGRQLADRWRDLGSTPEGEQHLLALALSFMSHDIALSPAIRFWALRSGVEQLLSLCKRAATPLRLSGLARMSGELGLRAVAVQTLQQIIGLLSQHPRLDATEPFLVCNERFDSVDPRGDLFQWLLAGSLEELERRGSLSSFFTDNVALSRLETIASLGYGDAEMARRLQLMRMRFS